MNRTIKRGEIYLVDLSPVIGSEQGGKRPVVIIQNDVGNHFSPTVIVAAMTAKLDKANLPTHILLLGDKSDLKSDSLILLEQIRTIDKSRLISRIGELDEKTVEKLNFALRISLDL